MFPCRCNDLILPTLTIFAVFVVAGCATGNSTYEDTLTTSGGQPATTRQPSEVKFTSASLKGRLLKVTDLPAGFTATTADSSDNGPSGCEALDAVQGLKAKAAVKAEVLFIKGEGVQSVSEAVVQVSEAQARAFIAKLSTAIKQCDASAAKSQGQDVLYSRLAALNLPKLGDQAYALRVTLTLPGFPPVDSDLVAVRAGTLLLLITNGGPGASPDADFTVALVRKALAKLQA